MPTYQYACRSCGHDFEIVQSFSDDPLTECPACDDGELRKVFSPIGITFKGSGFYKTDSRSSSGSSKKETAESTSSSDGAASSGSKKDSSSSTKSGSAKSTASSGEAKSA